jgi:hypothetical protein
VFHGSVRLSACNLQYVMLAYLLLMYHENTEIYMLLFPFVKFLYQVATWSLMK